MDVDLTGASPEEVRAAMVLGLDTVTPEEAVRLADTWLVADIDHPAVVDLAIGRAALVPVVIELVPEVPAREEAFDRLVRLTLRQGRTGVVAPDEAGQRLAVLLRHLVGVARLPDEHLLRRLAAADAAVLEALAAALDGADVVTPGPEAPVDADEAIRRLLVAAPDFSWEASTHDDDLCAGPYSDAAALAGWTGRDIARLDPLVPTVEELLEVGTEAGRALVVVGFLEDLLPRSPARARLGPRGRAAWDDLTLFWNR